MKHLCDSNVFIALAVEAHPHHLSAVQWIRELAPGALLYFCRATQMSFLRLLTVREWMKDYVCTNSQAIETYQTLLKDPRIAFLASEPPGLELQWLENASGAQPSPKRWMDAYLAALATTLQMSFVTFDRAFSASADLKLIVLSNS